MSETSPRLELPFLAAGQAQKEATHNEALQRVDMLVQPVALSADLSTPPGDAATGRCWIVPSGATGAWTGADGSIAQWTTGGWRFAVPAAGWRCHVVDRGGDMIHDGTAWRDDALRPDGLFVGGRKVVGTRNGAIASPAGGGTVDAEARGAVVAILSALRSHGLIEP